MCLLPTLVAYAILSLNTKFPTFGYLAGSLSQRSIINRAISTEFIKERKIQNPS